MPLVLVSFSVPPYLSDGEGWGQEVLCAPRPCAEQADCVCWTPQHPLKELQSSVRIAGDQRRAKPPPRRGSRCCSPLQGGPGGSSVPSLGWHPGAAHHRPSEPAASEELHLGMMDPRQDLRPVVPLHELVLVLTDAARRLMDGPAGQPRVQRAAHRQRGIKGDSAQEVSPRPSAWWLALWGHCSLGVQGGGFREEEVQLGWALGSDSAGVSCSAISPQSVSLGDIAGPPSSFCSSVMGVTAAPGSLGRCEGSVRHARKSQQWRQCLPSVWHGTVRGGARLSPPSDRGFDTVSNLSRGA